MRLKRSSGRSPIAEGTRGPFELRQHSKPYRQTPRVRPLNLHRRFISGLRTSWPARRVDLVQRKGRLRESQRRALRIRSASYSSMTIGRHWSTIRVFHVWRTTCTVTADEHHACAGARSRSREHLATGQRSIGYRSADSPAQSCRRRLDLTSSPAELHSSTTNGTSTARSKPRPRSWACSVLRSAVAVDKRLLVLPGFVSTMLVVHATHGWYPLLPSFVASVFELETRSIANDTG